MLISLRSDPGELAEKIHEAAGIMNNAVDHEGPTGTKHYAKGKAWKVARDARTVTKAYFGDFISWPEDINEEFCKENAKTLADKFAGMRKEKRLKVDGAPAPASPGPAGIPDPFIGMIHRARGDPDAIVPPHRGRECRTW